MAVLGYLPKLKRGLGQAFLQFSSFNTFSASFFHKNVPYLIFYHLTKLPSHTCFSFSRYQTKYVIKFLDFIQKGRLFPRGREDLIKE